MGCSQRLLRQIAFRPEIASGSPLSGCPRRRLGGRKVVGRAVSHSHLEWRFLYSTPNESQRKCSRLDEHGNPWTTQFDPMDPTLRDPAVSCCKLGEYYIPAAKNNPTFDTCFLLGQVAFALQIAISPTHSINAKGFDILEGVLPTEFRSRAFVFVVPSSKAQKFTCPIPTGDAQDKFRYFVLPLEHRDSKYCPSSVDI